MLNSSAPFFSRMLFINENKYFALVFPVAVCVCVGQRDCNSVSVCLPSYEIVFASFWVVEMRQTQKKATKTEMSRKRKTQRITYIFILPFLFAFYHITLFIDENKNRKLFIQF